MARKSKEYDESSVQVHSGLRGLRIRPEMYIGSVDSSGIVHLMKELGDNFGDEHGVGRATQCKILVDGSSIYVVDDGQGFPVKPIKFEDDGGKIVREPAIIAMVSRLHAGAKFNSSAYEVSGGTHGVGIKAVNALSSNFRVTTFKDGSWWTVSFAKGRRVTDLEECSAPKLPFKHKPFKKGSVIQFEPDTEIFNKGAKFDPKEAAAWADLTAYLHAGASITLRVGDKEKTYIHENGVGDFVEAQVANLKCETLSDTPFLFNHSHIDIALQFTDAEGDHVRAFTSGIKNPDGGEHVRALWASLTAVLKTYQKRGQEFTSQDLREGVIGLMNYKLSGPKFSSQTKEKLVDERVYPSAVPLLTDALTAFFKKNKDVANMICERASAMRAAKTDASAMLKSVRALKVDKNGKKAAVPDKLADCDPKCPPEEAELYVVEGDSAGGTAKQARFRYYQAVLPLKGKPLNAMKEDESRVLASVSIASILLSLRFQPHLKDPLSNLRYSKLIFMADPDDDGFHINVLCLALIQKFLPGMFERGMVYVLDSFKCKYFGRSTKGDYVFGSSPKDVEDRATAKKMKLTGKVTYLKGWGELNPAGLKEAAMDPERRSLIQLGSLDRKQANSMVSLLGDDPTARKELMGV